MLSETERQRIVTGAEQAREDWEETGLASARRAHRALMKLLAADHVVPTKEQDTRHEG